MRSSSTRRAKSCLQPTSQQPLQKQFSHPGRLIKGSPVLATDAGTDEPVKVGAKHTAYIEFTSGTTGKPKGVMVSAGAVASYLKAMETWYDFGPEDRAAETCDITFDLSVHNMLSTWKAGGALHIMRPLDMIAPARFVRAHQITTWLAVPSVVAMTRKQAACLPTACHH